MRRAQAGQARLALVFAVAVCAGGFVTASAVSRSLNATRAHVSGLDRPAAKAPAQAAAKPRTATAGAAVSRPGALLPKSAIPLLHAHAVTLPGSSIVSEPSVAVDSAGTFFVTGPTGIGHAPSISASPLWKSNDGGVSFTGPISTGIAGQTLTEVGGGDSDLVVDGSNNLYLVSLWLGNSSMAVSSDGGTTWLQQPLGHSTPVDDRPWLAYDANSDALYMTWDGGDGIHVARALLRAATTGTTAAAPSSLVFLQDTVVVPESALGGTPLGAVARECVCPPGGITVDSAGNVYVAYSSQNGVAVAMSSDQGLTWTSSYVPGTVPTAGAAQLDYIFQPIKADSAGNVYLAFSSTAVNARQIAYVSYLQRGTTAWSAPVQVSATSTAVLPTLAVVSPGVVDVAYYGTDSWNGDPNSAPASTEWDVYLAQVHDLFTAPSILTANAYSSVHDGVISTGGIGGSGDRSLGDFFSMVVDSYGMAGIITCAGDASHGTRLVFIHQTSQTLSPAPTTLSVPAPTSRPGSAAGGAAAAPAPAPAQAQPVYPLYTYVPAPAPASGTTVDGGADAARAASSHDVPAIGEPKALAHAAASNAAPLANPMWALAALVLVTAGAGLLLHRLNRRG